MGPLIGFLLFFVMTFVIVSFLVYKLVRHILQKYFSREEGREQEETQSPTTSIEIPEGARQPSRTNQTIGFKQGWQIMLSTAISSGTVLKTSDNEIMGYFGDDSEIIHIEETVCTICLLEYQHGDDICRSHNMCNHVFHRKCILEWLVRNNECPCCRGSFVDLEQGNSGDAETVAPVESQA